MSLVSVVIPVHNVEKYVKECLISFLNQTFRDFELIFVDDDSKDSTYKIIEGFIPLSTVPIALYRCEELCPDEVKGVSKNKKAMGAGVARNFGLQKASGKWVVFFDGDDFCEHTFLEKMVKKAEATECDVTVCASAEYIEKKQAISRLRAAHTFQNFDKSLFNGVYSLIDIVKIGCPQVLEFVEPWNKIYRKEFLTKNGILFPKTLCAEDTPFAYEVLTKAARIAFEPCELVYIRRRAHSLSFSTNKNWENYFIAYDLADKIILGYEHFNEIKTAYFDRKMAALGYFYKKAGILNKIPYFLKFKNEINKANRILQNKRY